MPADGDWEQGLQGGIYPRCWQGTCPQAQLSESSVFRAALNLPSLRMVGGFIAIKPWARLKDI